MKSSYQIIPRLVTPSIIAGETIEILLFITGYGKIEKQKLNLIHSSKKLLDEKEPGYLYSNIAKVKDNETGQNIIKIGESAYKHSKHKLDLNGTHLVLSPHYFLDRNVIKERAVSPPPKHGIPSICGEVQYDVPPIVIKYKTNSKAPSGDHKIDLILTYGDRIKNKGSKNGENDNGENDNGNNDSDDDDNFEFSTDHKVITVHVKTWMEKDGWKWAVGGTLIALGSLLYPVVIQLFPCLQNVNLC